MRLDFKESDIKQRSFLTPDQIRSRNERIYGIKVQIKDPLITEILVKDPNDKTFKTQNRAQRMIKKTINLANEFNTVSEQIKAIHELEKNKTAFTDEQLQQLVEVIERINVENIDDKEVLRELNEDFIDIVDVNILRDIPSYPFINTDAINDYREEIKLFSTVNWGKKQLIREALKTPNRPILSIWVDKNNNIRAKVVSTEIFEKNLDRFEAFVKGRYFDLNYTAFVPNNVKIISGNPIFR